MNFRIVMWIVLVVLNATMLGVNIMGGDGLSLGISIVGVAFSCWCLTNEIHETGVKAEVEVLEFFTKTLAEAANKRGATSEFTGSLRHSGQVRLTITAKQVEVTEEANAA